MLNSDSGAGLVDAAGHGRLRIPPGQPNGTGAGFLEQLVGTWENILPNSGLTLISVPVGGPTPARSVSIGGLGYLERYTFSVFGTPARDRGYLQRRQQPPLKESDIYLGGLFYFREANDTNPQADPVSIHGETGQWMHVTKPAGEGPAPPWTLMRMSDIPHGTTVAATGDYAVVSCTGGTRPCMEAEYDSLSMRYSSEPLNYDCDDEALADYWASLANTPGTDAGLARAHDPVNVLRDATKNLTILNYTRWDVSTVGNSTQGEGLVNNPWMQQQVSPRAFNTTFYLLTVDAGNGETYQLLQYIEGLYMDFLEACGRKRVAFPHIMVNTLRRAGGGSRVEGLLNMMR